MLDEQQIASFKNNGYLVVPGLVPDALCDEVIAAILEFAGIDVTDDSSWYQSRFAGHGIVPMHHDQALWNLRQHPPIHEVFADLYGTRALWVSNDRVSYKPPVSNRINWSRPPVHWDCDPWTFDALSMQGLVYLTDTAANQGAFMCAPGVYKGLDTYLVDHADDEDRRHPDIVEPELVSVAGEKGSLVVFNRLMPHTSGQNQSADHRFVQYVTMMEVDENQRDARIAEWREKKLPEWAIRQEISQGKTHEQGDPAELTALGRKLVGLDVWS